MRAEGLSAVIILGLAASSCSSEDPAALGCTRDTECEGGEICQATACVLPAKLDCTEGGDAVAVLLAEPARLEFGILTTEPVTRSVTLRNNGTCNLVVPRVEVEGGSNSRFVCNGCLARTFPVTIYPERDLRIEVTVQPGAPGLLEDRLFIATNDPTQREVFLDLTAESAGLPDLTVDPLALDFGFVPAGQVAERVVQAINSSDGAANLEILSAQIDPPDSPAFTVAPMTLLPATLAPARVDASARVGMTVRYQPPEEMAYTAALVLTPRDAAPIRVTLVSSGDPPTVSVSPTTIDLGTVRLGETSARVVTIQNSGRSDLVGRMRLQVGASSDLTLPQSSLRLAPGGLFEMGVIYEPTRGGSVGDTIVLETNDPAQPTVNVTVVGTAVAAAEQVISVEMTFENDSDSPLDKDLRDVDLILESPLGLVVRKASPLGSWGNYGAARWSAAPGDNPERVVLGRTMVDGEYLVSLSYVEDCKTLPTALTASLLGIGADELVQALTEGEVGMIDQTQLASAIMRSCAQRSSTNATLTTTIDGAPVNTRQMRLGQKGELAPVMRLRVENGRFTVVDL